MTDLKRVTEIERNLIDWFRRRGAVAGDGMIEVATGAWFGPCQQLVTLSLRYLAEDIAQTIRDLPAGPTECR